MEKFKAFMETLSGWKRFFIFYGICIVASAAMQMPYPTNAFVSFVAYAVLIFWIAASFIYKTPKQLEKQRLEQLQKAELELRAEEAKLRKMEAEKKALEAKQRKEEQERTCGRIVTRIAGVTFPNPDGSSRQKILKAAYEEGCAGDLQLDTYIFNGSDAIRVLYDGLEIGNIPAAVVDDVMKVFDRIVDGDLWIETFHPEEEDKPDVIYRADLTIIYSKDEMQSL